MKYVLGVVAVGFCFWILNPVAAANAGGQVWQAFGPLISVLLVGAIIVFAFKIMFGGVAGGGGGGGGKKKK